MAWVRLAFGFCLLVAQLGATRQESDQAASRRGLRWLPQLEAARRLNLVVAAVGDATQHELWLSDAPQASWDLVLLYYGASPTFTCAECLRVLPMRGAKWYLLHQLTQRPDWRQLAEQYRYIALPDDDLIMDTQAINVVFKLMEQHELELAQPSRCRYAAPAALQRRLC